MPGHEEGGNAEKVERQRRDAGNGNLAPSIRPLHLAHPPSGRNGTSRHPHAITPCDRSMRVDATSWSALQALLRAILILPRPDATGDRADGLVANGAGAVATVSTGSPSPHRTTGSPGTAPGCVRRSIVIRSIDTRPMMSARRPLTSTGVPDGTWRGSRRRNHRGIAYRHVFGAFPRGGITDALALSRSG